MIVEDGVVAHGGIHPASNGNTVIEIFKHGITLNDSDGVTGEEDATAFVVMDDIVADIGCRVTRHQNAVELVVANLIPGDYPPAAL